MFFLVIFFSICQLLCSCCAIVLKDFLKIVFCLILFSAFSTLADDRSYFHIEGKWAYWELHNEKMSLVFGGKPFEVYIGETNYYFTVNSRDGDWVGTYDGMDYFWVNYFFPLANEANIIGSKTNWMGTADVGSGSFPSNASPVLQSMWLAFFWQAHTNEFPAGQCTFELQRMRDDDVARYDEFTVVLNLETNNDSISLKSAKFYAPGHGLLRNSPEKKEYFLRQPYDKGWLYSAIEMFEKTNLSGQTFPVHFTFSDYMKKGESATNSNDVVMAVQYEFQVDKCSLVTALPLLYPPTYKGKMVAVNDYRDNTKVKLNYFVGGIDKNMPGNATFVSRNTLEYRRLLNGQEWKGFIKDNDFKKMSGSFRYAFLIGFITISALFSFFLYKITKSSN
jgi:hypothetical protein